VLRMKTIKFYTLGCKVNQYDTQEIRERFLRAGLKERNNGKAADIYLINTCTVTRNADNDSLGLIRRARRENPKARIIVTGCLVEQDAGRIKKTEPKAEVVKMGTFLFFKNKKEKRPHFGISYFCGHTRAFLKIQDGCNNFCSYCKVPLVRGASRSKPLSQIKEEARRLAENKFKEIVLCGICLGAYGKDLKPSKTLIDVIEELEKIEGILRIRLSSIEAADVTDELIEKLVRSKKLCHHLHIPIQSGDDEILKKMNRRYTSCDYLELVRKIKRSVSGIAITTDVLVGFPGETEENFRNTAGLIKKILPLRVHIFPYSRREGTQASVYPNEINPGIIKERISRLKKVADACSLTYKREFLGQKMAVLIEGRSKEHPGFWEGYADNYIKALIKSRKNLKNQLTPVKLKEIGLMAHLY